MVLGLVLVLAGALKSQQLLTDPSVGRATGFPRELLMGTAAFELAFGCWLLAGLYRRLTRWLALAWFTSLAAVALAQALGGASACPCFGELHAHPWFMFVIDVLAVLALWTWSPLGSSSRSHLPLILFLSLLPSVALLGLARIPRSQPLFAEIDLGDVVQGGQKEQPFHIRNGSRTFVEIAAVESSCACGRIYLEGNRVVAGQSLAGNVTLDLRHKPTFVGDLAIDVKGLTPGKRAVLLLVIRARVYPAFQADRHSL